MKFISFLFLLTIAFVFSCNRKTETHSESKTSKLNLSKPNIIFVLADDLGYGDLGCYGQKMLKSPNLDKMASEGIQFTNCYAGNTVCCPSRSALLTGLHSGHAVHRGNYGDYKGEQAYVPFEKGTKTFATYIKQAGYKTGHVGKWHNGGTTADKTSPSFLGFDYSFSHYPNYLWTTEIKKQVIKNRKEYYFDYYWRNEEKIIVEENRNMAGKIYCEETYTNEALDFIKRNKDTTFMLYLAYTSPHAPQVPYTEEPFENEDWPELERKFAAEVFYLDKNMGKLFQLLKDLEIDENTIVFFTSDNGPHNEQGHDHTFFNSNGNLRGYKRNMSDGGIKVPLLVRWPGKIKASSETDHICSFYDMLPTFCELGNAQSPGGIDGISIAPTLLGNTENQKKHKYLYWENTSLGKQAVRMGRWKGIRLNVNKEGFEAPIALYDLSTDIGEEKDVASQFPEVVEQIKKFMTESHVENPYFKFK
ncbi:arylsulfatase, partial [Draconibacterium sp.]|nr:arylsulfatase [Draconibacterium sp.]